MKEDRQKWRNGQESLDADQLVFLDETWAKTNMSRSRGRAPRAERVIDYVPYGHWNTTTFLSGLRRTGLVAPLVVDGPINGEIFLAWVEQHLVPTLRKGDIVIMDNLSSHKVQGVREAIEGVGATVLYLPAYSPDFNPIELVFSKLKSLLKMFKERSVEALWHRIGSVIAEFSPQECDNYFRHCGYGLHNG